MVARPTRRQRIARRLLALLVGALVVTQGLVAMGLGRVPWRASVGNDGAAPAIVAVGDSITYGYGDTAPGGGWVTRLARRLSSDEPGTFRLINAGVNGDTAAGVLARLDGDVLAYKPRLVLVSIGTNDFDYSVPRGEFQAALTTIVRRLRAARALVVLVSTLPEAGASAAALRAQSAYNAVIPAVAAATGAGYMDEYDRWLALGSTELTRLRQDAEHPNRIGYQLLADDMAAFLESQYLDDQGRLVAPAPRPGSDLLVGNSGGAR